MSGPAIALPTMTAMCTPSFSMSSQALAGSNDPAGVITTFPPPNRAWNDAQCALTCMSGGVTSMWRPCSGTRPASCSARSIGPSSVLGSPPPIEAKKMSSCRHITPLGRPVVPPVQRM